MSSYTCSFDLRARFSTPVRWSRILVSSPSVTALITGLPDLGRAVTNRSRIGGHRLLFISRAECRSWRAFSPVDQSGQRDQAEAARPRHPGSRGGLVAGVGFEPT